MKKTLLSFIFLFLISLNNISFATKSHKLKFFNIDLHISVIADIKNIFESLGHEVTNKLLSSHAWVFGREKDNLKVINATNVYNIDQKMIDDFYNEYKDELDKFDAFIVTHASELALLYKNFNKPIIIVNSTRYSNISVLDQNKTKILNDFLKEGIEKNKIFIISNNKGDQNYLKYFTGIESELIPSLCLYTNSKYLGKNDGFIIKGPDLNIQKQLNHPELIQNELLPKRYKWQELYNFKGIIHFPLNISTMSIFEQYSANVPLFFPTKEFLLSLHYQHPKEILSQLSFFQVLNMPSPNISTSPDNTNNTDIIKQWIDLADFYDLVNMPYIQYFNSIHELENLLNTSDLKSISANMQKHNKTRYNNALKQWTKILNKVQNSIDNQ